MEDDFYYEAMEKLLKLFKIEALSPEGAFYIP